jgi:hypothetical protein
MGSLVALQTQTLVLLLASITLADGFDVASVLTQCAIRRDAPAASILRALEAVEAKPAGLPVRRDNLAGTWELVFSSAAARVPFVDGYMPNRELLTWDLDARRLDLTIETLPLLPSIKVVGEHLTFDQAEQTLTYTVGNKPESRWNLLFFDRDEGVIAARSSVTGLNVIRRLDSW